MTQTGFMMLKKLSVAFLITLLAGCGSASFNSALSTTYISKVNYQDVFERAREQANYCWRTETGYPVVAELNSTNKTAFVAVTGLFGSSRMAELTAREVEGNSTEVKIAVDGVSVWNAGAIRAMKDAVEFGVPSCTSYMPTKS